MKAVRFVMVGGFLGAGKTTMLARLARHYQSQGMKVGIITNDQANNLVDTHTFQANGLPTREIPGGCFCCRFDALTEAAGDLLAAERPDILLAEPVGSCTDLIATVVQPLKRLYAAQYQIAPYVVLVDPVRAEAILAGEHFGGFSPKVAYIFDKQLEEADAIATNKADLLTADRRDQLAALLAHNYRDKQIFAVSARTGEGIEALLAMLNDDGEFGHKIASVDYDVYAEGEAELGWLNSTMRLRAAQPFSLDEFLFGLAGVLKTALDREGEVAHLKLLICGEDHVAIVNLTRGDAVPELSLNSGASARDAELIVNARVHMEPESLRDILHNCLATACGQRGIDLLPGAQQYFKPGRPVPTHRYADAI